MEGTCRGKSEAGDLFSKWQGRVILEEEIPVNVCWYCGPIHTHLYTYIHGIMYIYQYTHTEVCICIRVCTCIHIYTYIHKACAAAQPQLISSVGYLTSHEWKYGILCCYSLTQKKKKAKLEVLCFHVHKKEVCADTSQSINTMVSFFIPSCSLC